MQIFCADFQIFAYSPTFNESNTNSSSFPFLNCACASSDDIGIKGLYTNLLIQTS